MTRKENVGMKNRWTAVLCGLTVFGTALWLSSCSKAPSGGEEGGPEVTPVPEVTVTKVQRGDVSRMLTLPGVVAALPNQDVKVGALIAGRVTQVSVAEGDRVTAGQVIAKLDEAPLQNDVQKAEAAAAQARATLENAKLALTRNEDLLSRGIAARKDVEDARTASQVADAAVKQADTEVAAARLQVTRAEVKSPLSGVVVKRFVSGGEQVDGTPDHPLVEVANLDEVELNASAPPEQAGLLRAGESISFHSAAFPGRTFSGRLVVIAAQVDPATNSVPIRIRIGNAEGLLRLGMFLSAEIPVETHTKTLLVPPQAIYLDEDNKTQVYRVVGDKATSVPVKVGIETPDKTELLSGVTEGDTVILTGGSGIDKESKVSVQEPGKAEAPDAKGEAKGDAKSAAQGEAKDAGKDEDKK